MEIGSKNDKEIEKELNSSQAYETITTPVMGRDNEDDSVSENLDSRIVYANSSAKNQPFNYCNNIVITSKYSIISFLPKFLLESFRQLANMFFLIICCLQMVPKISNTNQRPTNLPVLAFVISIDAVFAILEDIRRHRADRAANSAICHVVDTETGHIVDHTWSDLKVGDIVQIRNREVSPADVLILSVADQAGVSAASGGICYVETKSLDGETNLKLRQAMEPTMTETTNELVSRLDICVVCETPNAAITKFNGKMEYKEEFHPISIKNVLLRGCNLRNTEYIYGLVLNTGTDTKIMRNASAAPSKWSSMTKSINQMIIFLAVMLVLLCVIASSIYTSLLKTFSNRWYLQQKQPNAVDGFIAWIIQLFYFILLMYQIIPISLYVSMTTVKFLQAIFMSWDIKMYHEETDTPAIVRTMALNEELGQISYIFSDKTGTLTCNVMDFMKCSINGVLYGKGLTEIGKGALLRAGKPVPSEPLTDPSHPRMPYVNFVDNRLWDVLEGKKDEESLKKAQEFFTHLSLCHTVIPEQLDSGEIRLSASSPDEQALVAGAAFFGYKFDSRRVGGACVTIKEQKKEFDVLEVLEFNSTRKRMSIVIRDNGKLKLYTKGADMMVFPLIKQDTEERKKLLETTRDHMEELADDGLRTLAIACKSLNEEEYKKWSKEFKEALGNLDELEKRKDGEENRIDQLMNEIERDLELLGATAIEDKLQKGVPECLASLSLAGIKLWMLTGDKEETAINIGYACSLLDNSVQQVIVNLKNSPTVYAIKQRLIEATFQVEKRKRKSSVEERNPSALIIDGEALDMALSPECALDLLAYARLCKTVICCRVSPAQKAQMVLLVKTNIPTVKTLAIGDGANDVAMIQAAHIGVGISGQEGLQAVNSSDYAIAQFRFLKRLLLIHGRNNYTRLSKLVLYMFYKNIVLVLAQYWYSYVGAVSGQKFYWEFGVQVFNIVFTAFPIVLLGVFDKDLPDRFSLLWPELYTPGRKDLLFNSFTFLRWICAALYESFLVFAIAVFTFNGFQSSVGNGAKAEYGMLAFSLSVMITNLKICLIQNQWTWISILGWTLGVFSWFFVAWIGSSFSVFCTSPISYDECGSFLHVASAPVFWFLLIIGPFVALLRHFTWNQLQRQKFPHLYQILQEKIRIEGASNVKRNDMPMYLVDEQEVSSGPLSEEQEQEQESVLKINKEIRRSQSFRNPLTEKPQRNTGFAFSFDQDTTRAESFIAGKHFDSPILAINSSHQQSKDIKDISMHSI